MTKAEQKTFEAIKAAGVFRRSPNDGIRVTQINRLRAAGFIVVADTDKWGNPVAWKVAG